MNPHAAKALFDAALAQLGSRVLTSRGWVIHSQTFPVLDLSFRDLARQELRLRLGCDDWNDSPPAVTLLCPDGSLLTRLPQQRPGQSIFNGSAHPNTGRPFVCMAGVLEYHQHTSHLNDLWTNYKTRDSYTLANIVDQLWRGWQRYWP